MRILCKIALCLACSGANAQTVTYVVPGQGPLGQCLEIVGSGFTGAHSVLFGSVPATGYTVASDTHIIVNAPPQGAGTVTVSVK